MPDQFIVEHCSPTLAGLKTGNLFSVRISGKEKSYREIRELNKTLTKYGLRAIPVRCTDEMTLVYVYRPEYLSRDLSDPEAVEILRKMGYLNDAGNGAYTSAGLPVHPEKCLVRTFPGLSAGRCERVYGKPAAGCQVRRILEGLRRQRTGGAHIFQIQKVYGNLQTGNQQRKIAGAADCEVCIITRNTVVSSRYR